MDFSGIAVACDSGWACRLDAAKYTPAKMRMKAAATPAIRSGFLFAALAKVFAIFAGPDGSWRRCATSVADCGRRDGSFARQPATTFSQSGETDVASILNSFRRSVIEGATRSQI